MMGWGKLTNWSGMTIGAGELAGVDWSIAPTLAYLARREDGRQEYYNTSTPD